MRIRLLCLLALAALTSRATAAKPPDLPDNPPIVVAPIPSLPPSPWVDAPSIFPAQPAVTEYEVTLSPDGERFLLATLLLNAHPFVAFLSSEQSVACDCPPQPADKHAWAAADLVATRTVLENLQALEKASECLSRAEKMAKEGKLVEAAAALEQAQKLVPGSPCAQRAGEMLKTACAAMQAKRGDCEEAEEGAGSEWGCLRSFKQFGMCQVNGLCEQAKQCEKTAFRGAGQEFRATHLMRPITVHCDNTPLRVVLEELRDMCGIHMVVEGKVCLDRPVCVHAERTPICTVLEMVLRPMGYTPKVCGQVVHVCGEKACCTKGGSECCEESKCCVKKKCCSEEGCCKEAAGPKMCGGSACPKCDALHAKRNDGVEEMVTYLLKGCYLAIEQERYEIAADLARQAKSLDPVRVEGDPVVYKFSLLGECGGQKPCPQSCPGACRPSNNYPVQKQPEGEDLSLRPKLPAVDPAVVESLDAIVVSNEPVCVVGKDGTRKHVLFGNISGGTLVLNERNFDCHKGSVFTQVMRTHGWEWAKTGADALTKLYVAEPIPDDSRQGCLSLGLSSSGAINVYCRAVHEDTVYNATLKDGFFVMWTKPAKGEKAE